MFARHLRACTSISNGSSVNKYYFNTPSFAGQTRPKASDFSGRKKILSTPTFGGEVKRRSHVVDLRHVKDC